MRWLRKQRTEDPPRRVRDEGPKSPGDARGPATQEVAQINIRGDYELIETFRQLCRSERRTYSDMLGILIKHYGGAPEAEPRSTDRSRW